MIEIKKVSKIFQENYESITESIDELTIIINQKNDIEYINNIPLIKYLGYKRDDLIGNSLLNYVYSDELENVTNLLENLSKDKPIAQKLRLRHIYGFFKTFQVSAQLIKNSKKSNYSLLILKPAQELNESEEFYKTILDGIVNGIWVTNKEDKIFFTNKGMGNIAGISIEKIVGAYVLKDFPESTLKYFKPYYLEVKDTLNPVYYSAIPIITPAGRQSYQSGWLIPRCQNGHYNGMICTVEDITERIIAEEKLKKSKEDYKNLSKELEQRVIERTNELLESEEKYRTIAEQSSMGILIQQEGQIKFANNAVSEIVGFPLQEIYKWTVKDKHRLVHKDDLPLIIENSKRRQNGDFDSTFNYECRIFTKSQVMKWIEVLAKPIKYLGKNAILSTYINITDIKKVEEELKEISRLKTDLLSRTSHELKTPLVSIKGYADLLLSQHYEELDFYTISILHEIKQGCSRLEDLIKDLLETSKLESDDIELHKEKDDLAFLIRFCIRELQGLIENRNHRLILKIKENLITEFEKERIYEVIMNLLSNAIKYTPPSGIITIKARVANESYIICVQDNGIGLTNEEKGKIFKKFGKIERYGQGFDVVSEGSGLGLYISKRIIDLHGGKIWVESEGRNKGSIFCFSLPIIKD